jgi:hypothetical protein
MATGNKLEVGIGADISEFEKKIKEVEFDIKELSKVKLDKLKLGLDTTEINNNIKDAKKSLNELKGTVKDSSSAFSSMSPKVANGSNALMQFSRIAQDAPYGIMGIGNNLTATAEAFSYLQKETGSTGGALKALGSSLMGSGGILLGISLLTTGITYLSQSGLSLGDVINQLTGNFDEYLDSLKKANLAAYNDSGVISSVQNVKQLRDEVGLAKDGFLDKTKVVEHYNETMGKTSGLVKTLDEVEKQLVKNGDAYIKMQLYKATATLAQAEAAKEMLNREKVSQESADKHIGTLGYLKAAFQGVASGNLYATASTFAFTNGLKNQAAEISNSTKKMNANIIVAEKYNKLAAEIAKKSGFNFFDDTKENSALKEKEIKKPKFEFKKGFIPGGIVAPAINFDSMLLSMDIVPDEVSAKLLELKKLLNDFNAEANDIIGGSITSTFQNLGDSIGNALANGGNVLSAIGKSLIQSLGMFLSDMGGLLIKYGVLAIAKGKLDVAIAAGGPLSIGAGVAAIAVGIALKAAGGALSSKASGGQGANTSTGSTANNSSFSSGGFSSSSGNGGTVVFEIAGQKLIGVLSNTLNANKRLGGQLGLSNG